MFDYSAVDNRGGHVLSTVRLVTGNKHEHWHMRSVVQAILGEVRVAECFGEAGGFDPDWAFSELMELLHSETGRVARGKDGAFLQDSATLLVHTQPVASAGQARSGNAGAERRG